MTDEFDSTYLKIEGHRIVITGDDPWQCVRRFGEGTSEEFVRNELDLYRRGEYISQLFPRSLAHELEFRLVCVHVYRRRWSEIVG